MLAFIVTSLLTSPLALSSHHPLKLTKKAWPCQTCLLCCAPSNARTPLDESFNHIWAFISFVISRGLHHGLLPKRDKVVESTHTSGLVFWGSCSPNCRSSASSIVGSRGHLGWNIQGLSWLCRRFSLGCPWQWRPGKRTGSVSCAVSPVTK